MIAALCVTEISSPFLHLRELLKELGYRDTDLNLAADVSYPLNLIIKLGRGWWVLCSSISCMIGVAMLHRSCLQLYFRLQEWFLGLTLLGWLLLRTILSLSRYHRKMIPCFLSFPTGWSLQALTNMVYSAVNLFIDAEITTFIGNGIGITACQRLLVLQDCQDDELQANQKGCF